MRITIDIDGTEVAVDAAATPSSFSSAPLGPLGAEIEVFNGGAAPAGAVTASRSAPTTLAGLTVGDSGSAINAGAAPIM